MVLGPIHSQNRLSLTLKDSSVVILERLPITVAKKLKEYLETIKQGKQTGVFECVMHISVYLFCLSVVNGIKRSDN